MFRLSGLVSLVCSMLAMLAVLTTGLAYAAPTAAPSATIVIDASTAAVLKSAQATRCGGRLRSPS